jgi:hypothetical protein
MNADPVFQPLAATSQGLDTDESWGPTTLTRNARPVGVDLEGTEAWIWKGKPQAARQRDLPKSLRTTAQNRTLTVGTSPGPTLLPKPSRLGMTFTSWRVYQPYIPTGEKARMVQCTARTFLRRFSAAPAISLGGGTEFAKRFDIRSIRLAL